MTNIGTLEATPERLTLSNFIKSVTLSRGDIQKISVPPSFRLGLKGLQIHHDRSDLPRRLTFRAPPWRANSVLEELRRLGYMAG